MSLIQRFLGKLRFPQLFVVAALLFVLDVLIPDMIPFADEMMLALLTALLSQWKRSDRPPAPTVAKPPPKNVTPGA